MKGVSHPVMPAGIPSCPGQRSTPACDGRGYPILSWLVEGVSHPVPARRVSQPVMEGVSHPVMPAGIPSCPGQRSTPACDGRGYPILSWLGEGVSQPVPAKRVSQPVIKGGIPSCPAGGYPILSWPEEYPSLWWKGVSHPVLTRGTPSCLGQGSTPSCPGQGVPCPGRGLGLATGVPLPLKGDGTSWSIMGEKWGTPLGRDLGRDPCPFRTGIPFFFYLSDVVSEVQLCLMLLLTLEALALRFNLFSWQKNFQ